MKKGPTFRKAVRKTSKTGKTILLKKKLGKPAPRKKEVPKKVVVEEPMPLEFPEELRPKRPKKTTGPRIKNPLAEMLSRNSAYLQFDIMRAVEKNAGAEELKAIVRKSRLNVIKYQEMKFNKRDVAVMDRIVSIEDKELMLNRLEEFLLTRSLSKIAGVGAEYNREMLRYIRKYFRQVLNMKIRGVEYPGRQKASSGERPGAQGVSNDRKRNSPGH